MYLRTLLIIILMACLAFFAALNWNAFTTPTQLSVGFTQFEAPLGLILLGAALVLSVLFLIYVAYLQSSVLLEHRRHARELQRQRELAEEAEASRFNSLRAYLEGELHKLSNEMEVNNTQVLDRIEQVSNELRISFEQSSNSLAAGIGEIEDKLERAAQIRLPG